MQNQDLIVKMLRVSYTPDHHKNFGLFRLERVSVYTSNSNSLWIARYEALLLGMLSLIRF